MADRATPNLPSRDFDATEAFWGGLGFVRAWRDADWMILRRGPLEVEFFPHPALDPATSWFSACLRLDDIDALHAEWSALGLSAAPGALPRLTPPAARPPAPRMFALVDPDGSQLRCIDNG
jgi:hypothetical protein